MNGESYLGTYACMRCRKKVAFFKMHEHDGEMVKISFYLDKNKYVDT